MTLLAGRAAAWLLAGALAGPTGASAAGPAPTPAFELWFRLEAHLSQAALEASVLAGGRLGMGMEATAAGRKLVLERPLEDPWKLYSVRSGWFGKETKMAAEVTLPQPTWEALAEVRSRADRLALERLAGWKRRPESAGTLDGAFCFVVVGPPEGRFELAIAPQVRAKNRMTDHWLSGELDPLLKAWQAKAEGGAKPPQGYWFWNHGESRPFAWEPHAYHALAAAAQLLDLPLAPGRGGGLAAGSYEAEVPELGRRAREVLEILMPKARGRLGVSGGERLRWEVRVEGKQVRVRGRSLEASSSGPELELEREQGDGEEGPESDRLELRSHALDGWLELEVGYGPAGDPRARIPS
ncbi:MAG TPA: hypothetical protein PK413_01555 [Thermoanaerobaculia bacterium]|nr:hypothetical protein [Thermoanaerobaculia bacterium]